MHTVRCVVNLEQGRKGVRTFAPGSQHVQQHTGTREDQVRSDSCTGDGSQGSANGKMGLGPCCGVQHCCKRRFVPLRSLLRLVLVTTNGTNAWGHNAQAADLALRATTSAT
jgi:hypothetical protein